ncbi:MAG TPA: molybdopterin-binding protein [Candidatus Sulfomarinibacteraceae bacterium]|nr:molybdopterin-binding protein [Candidatus Sulfomarinibacteraceae bacterium]
MKVARIQPGTTAPATLAGAVLTRDIEVAGERWAKGRRLTPADLERVGRSIPVLAGRPITVLVPEPGDVHEDDAARRLAAAVAGPGLAIGEPAQSRIDLRATGAGVVHVGAGLLDRINAIDPVEVFTVLDGRVVEAGALVASVKVAPHLVPEGILAAAEAVAARGRGRRGVVSVAPFRPRRVAAIVKETIRGIARDRFEASVRAKVEGLGSRLVGIDYVEDARDPVTSALRRRALGRGPDRADLVLTAGSSSTDPEDPFFVALAALGGRVVRHGVPAHPGSMLWLGRVGSVAVIGLPSCGAYSKATAVDLLLPRLLAGEPASIRTVARLGHGGILTRDQRFRFPAYARELDAPEG